MEEKINVIFENQQVRQTTLSTNRQMDENQRERDQGREAEVILETHERQWKPKEKY
jgi:hypothetical protein